ncbi:MAG TPA: ABC transporter permease [Chthoniobacterales bacterium]
MTVIRLVLARLETGALLSALAVASIFALWTSNFLSLESITSVLIVTSESAILAIAVTLLMIAGEFDLSVGSVLGLSSVVVPLMMVNYQVPPLAAVMIAFAIAVGIGLLHGTIVRGLRIPSFIVTLGGLLFWRGIVFVITQGFPVRVPRGSGSLFDFFSYRFPNGFDVSLLWLIAWAPVFYVLLTQTGFGNWIYASGANERAARAMGVPVDRVRTILFVFTSVSACLAGLIQVGRFGSVDATRGQGLELEVIAASVIGGTSLSGGVGSIGGTILGCLIIGMIRNGLAIAGISSYWYTAIIGLLIVAAVLVNKATERFRKVAV